MAEWINAVVQHDELLTVDGKASVMIITQCIQSVLRYGGTTQDDRGAVARLDSNSKSTKLSESRLAIACII